MTKIIENSIIIQVLFKNYDLMYVRLAKGNYLLMNKKKRNIHYKKSQEQTSEKFSDIYMRASKAHKLKYSKGGRPVRRKRRKLAKIVVTISVILTLIIVGAISAFFYYFGGLNTDNDFAKVPQDLGLDSADRINDNVINIALFGLDKRANENVGRSDTVMILSLDGVHKKIKLTSILRDSRVNIDGHGKDKLCHAYAYGGPKMAVRTLNKNYNMDIMNYVTVDFSQMVSVINAVGGVDIELANEEVKAANGLIASTKELAHSEGIPYFKGRTKVMHLNGAQAVAYARIRKIDSEAKRAERQQKVMSALLEKVKGMSVVEYPNFVKQILPLVQTSLSYNDILGFIPFMMSGKPTMETYKIPDPNDPNVKGGIIDGTWYWSYSLSDYAKKLHKFIYNN